MSYPTELDAGVEPDGSRPGGGARRTLRDEVAGRVMAAFTRRDRPPPAGEEGAAWIAMPTTRGGVGGDALDMQREVPAELAERFVPLAWLARGAEADVWRARRRADGLDCVIKLYFPGIRPDATVLDALGEKSRQHVPVLSEHGLAQARYYEVWEYLSGGTLRDLLRFGRLDRMSARHLLVAMASALDALHHHDQRGPAVIHGDLKPENILLRGNDLPDFVLCDFGVSVPAGAEVRGLPARRGHTPHYSAPECLQGRPVPASDFWSLGIVLLEALSGRHPFADLSDAEVSHRVAAGSRPEIADDLPHHWRRLLGGLLQPQPELRWGGVEVRAWSRMAGTPSVPSEVEAEQRVFSTARELAVYLATHWAEASACLQREDSEGWLARQIAAEASDLWSWLRADTPVSADVRLLRLIYRLAPGLPPVWKGWSMAQEDVAMHCARATRGDAQSSCLVSELLAQDVLGELGLATGQEHLQSLGRQWRAAWMDYEHMRGILARLGAPVQHLPTDVAVQARLFTMLLGDRPSHDPIPLTYTLCSPWLAPLLDIRPQRSGLRLLATLLLQQWVPSHDEHLTETCELELGTPVQGRTVLQWGRAPPLVSLSAIHAPLHYTVCQQRLHIANRIRLSWRVTGAWLAFLPGGGLIDDQGELLRTHSSTVSYSLLALGRGGLTLMRLPPIPMQRLQLAVRVRLNEPLNMSIDTSRWQRQIQYISRIREMPRLLSPFARALGSGDLPQAAVLRGRDELRRRLGEEDLTMRLRFLRLGESDHG